MKLARISAILIGGLLISACGNEKQAEIERLSTENQELKQGMAQRDSTLQTFEESFTTIQRNLALISEREVAIQLKSGEIQLSDDSREEITKDIQAINNLLADNKETIERLNRRLASYGVDVSGYKTMIDQLQSDVDSKEEQIGYIKENLTAANFTIDILNEMLDSAEFRNEVQAGLIQMQSKELHTAYYALGSSRDLQRNDVIVKEGSIAGIAGAKKLKEDFNKDYFEQISTLDVREIPLNSRKAELVTNHPSGSYSIEGEDNKILVINDINRFWSSTRYLVVITD